MDYLASLFITVMFLRAYEPGAPWQVLLGVGLVVFVVAEIVIGFLLALTGRE